MTWEFLDAEDILAVHREEMTRREVDLSAIRADMGALHAAASRPRQLVEYGDPPPDASDIAASYLVAVVKAHAFTDGNKRAGWLAANIFLELNGLTLASPKDGQGHLRFIRARIRQRFAVRLVKRAATSMPLPQVAAWIRRRVREL